MRRVIVAGASPRPRDEQASRALDDTPPQNAVTTHTPLQRQVAARAVLLLAIGMVTGIWSGLALSGKVVVPIPHLALAAHLNALMGFFWLLGFAFTLPMLSYSDKGKERLAMLQYLPTYGNWFVTLIASFVGVRGIDFQGKLANDIIAALLLLIVVGPALVVTFAWAWGFKKPASATN